MKQQNPQFIVYTGPMASSKTSALLMMLEKFKYQNKKIVVFKPNMDKRYSASEIVTHNGFRHAALTVTDGDELVQFLLSQDEMPDVIAVDEAFMIKGVAASLIWLFQMGITVLVSSLDISATGKIFDEIKEMLPWATTVKKMTAVCVICGEDAHYTHRKHVSDDEIQVGGLEIYSPRCFNHAEMVNIRDYG